MKFEAISKEEPETVAITYNSIRFRIGVDVFESVPTSLFRLAQGEVPDRWMKPIIHRMYHCPNPR